MLSLSIYMQHHTHASGKTPFIAEFMRTDKIRIKHKQNLDIEVYIDLRPEEIFYFIL